MLHLTLIKFLHYFSTMFTVRYHSDEGDGIRVKGLLFLIGFDFSPDISDKSGMNFVATAEKRVAKFANHRHFLSPEGFPK